MIGVRCWAIFWILLSGQNAHPSRSVRHCSSLISISYCPKTPSVGCGQLRSPTKGSYPQFLSVRAKKRLENARDLTQRGSGTMMLVHGGWHVWVALLACGAPEETVGMFSLHDRIEQTDKVHDLTGTIMLKRNFFPLYYVCSAFSPLHDRCRAFNKIAGFQRT